MNKKLDKLVIIDIEATCWEEEQSCGQESEIIEIGVSLLDIRTLEVSDKEGIIVRPVNSTISPFCTSLTTLTQEVVNHGIPFATACELLQSKFKTKKRTWVSWGDYDRKQFEKQCNKMDVPYPFGSTHINVKNLFSILMNYPKEFGLQKASELIGIEMHGTHHRGMDDAFNIGRILARLFEIFRIKS